MSNVQSLKYYLRPIPLVAIIWSFFQLYSVWIGFFHPLIQYPVHVIFAVALVFLTSPIGREDKIFKIVDILLIIVTFTIGAYLVLNFERYSTRIPFVHSPTTMDIVAGVGLIALLFEVCRRTVGWSLTIVTGVFVIYAFTGKYMPGLLAHRGLSLESFVDLQILSPNGVFGIPTGVSAGLVFYFILFGAFLERSGGGALFTDIAYFLTGRVRGGAAKSGVISSALYGTISGSAVANVVITGQFTIPLMKRSGLSPAFAASTEAVASTGGQIMPPVMGAAAFILAQIVGVSYWEVVRAAIIPACLFYVALFFAIDFQAAKEGLVGLSSEDLPDVKTGLKQRIHLLVPLIAMIYYIVSGSVTPVTAAFRAIILTIIISFLRKATMMGPERFLSAMEKGAKESVSVAIPCAVAGIIIGVVIFSGLGLKFTDLMIAGSGGILIITMIFVMLATIVLGMGMPTSAAYLMGAILLAPALINLGVNPLAAHLFVFYFAVISMITPPVALASFTAASVSGSDLWETGLLAFRIALPGFLIPYIFVINNSLLLEGSVLGIIWVVFTTCVGIIGYAAGTIGYLIRRTVLLERILLYVGGVMLIFPEGITDTLGLLILLGVFIAQKVIKQVKV
ncbi:MAG: TRAP transporter permease [Deltaproteobacteria bacterium]|nr:TRAP transporter permease [Deltaproteobacteria bacterium]